MPLGPWITREDKAAVMAVLDSGDLMSGRQVALFEEELAAYFGKRHAVCVSSGTAALECAMSVGSVSGRLHPHGFTAAISASFASGFIPEQHSLGMRTDVLGVGAEPAYLVHDCAHRFDQLAAHAELSCFSFNQNKFIACCGGVVLTDDDAAAGIMRAYRNHGRRGHERVITNGRHHRMPEMNAAFGRSQLRRINEILARRKQVARWYDEITGRQLADTRKSWFLYPLSNAPALAKKHRSLADFRLFDTATQEDRETALLPIWPLMTREDCEEVCNDKIAL